MKRYDMAYGLGKFSCRVDYNPSCAENDDRADALSLMHAQYFKLTLFDSHINLTKMSV